jgi:hypothetical protein
MFWNLEPMGKEYGICRPFIHGSQNQRIGVDP